MPAGYVKSRTPINAETFTPILAPISCSYFALKNADGSAVTLRTDPSDANTEDTLSANGQESVTVGPAPDFIPGGPSKARFQSGSTVIWVKATQGVGPMIGTWVA